MSLKPFAASALVFACLFLPPKRSVARGRRETLPWHRQPPAATDNETHSDHGPLRTGSPRGGISVLRVGGRAGSAWTRRYGADAVSHEVCAHGRRAGASRGGDHERG